jgi:hypothetical protein
MVIRFSILTVLFWAMASGFVSYQNLGSSVRFRLQVLPIMLALLWYLGRAEKVAGPAAQPDQALQPSEGKAA